MKIILIVLSLFIFPSFGEYSQKQLNNYNFYIIWSKSECADNEFLCLYKEKKSEKECVNQFDNCILEKGRYSIENYLKDKRIENCILTEAQICSQDWLRCVKISDWNHCNEIQAICFKEKNKLCGKII